MVDPLKFYVIGNLLLPHTIIQLQILQGKDKLLCIFNVNFTEINKSFMPLLKKGVPFILDNQNQLSLDS